VCAPHRVDRADGQSTLPVAVPVPASTPFPYPSPWQRPATAPAAHAGEYRGTATHLTGGAEGDAVSSGEWRRRLEIAREEGRARARAQTAALRRSGRFSSPSSLDIDARDSPHTPAISPSPVRSTLFPTEGPSSVTPRPGSVNRPERWQVLRAGTASGVLGAAASSSKLAAQKGSPSLALKHMLEALQSEEDSCGVNHPARSALNSRGGALPDISADLFRVLDIDHE
jgi:hypothetical protein